MHKKKPSIGGVPLLKKHGQYFLRDHSVVETMTASVPLKDANVIEIGCGDGFLTREILRHSVAHLRIYEIDPMWAKKVEQELRDSRLEMVVTNVLDVDLSGIQGQAPWILLSNLPYHVTFPILHKVQAFRHLIPEGVVMMQEEVAQKIMKKSGRGYGYVSLFFQHYFEWKLLTKIPPTAFYPHPKVFSRLLHFKAHPHVTPIEQEKDFWRFIKLCFAHPRRTLKNNLMQTHVATSAFAEELLQKRAQQLSMDDFLIIWQSIRGQFFPVSQDEVGE